MITIYSGPCRPPATSPNGRRYLRSTDGGGRYRVPAGEWTFPRRYCRPRDRVRTEQCPRGRLTPPTDPSPADEITRFGFAPSRRSFPMSDSCQITPTNADQRCPTAQARSALLSRVRPSPTTSSDNRTTEFASWRSPVRTRHAPSEVMRAYLGAPGRTHARRPRGWSRPCPYERHRLDAVRDQPGDERLTEVVAGDRLDVVRIDSDVVAGTGDLTRDVAVSERQAAPRAEDELVGTVWGPWQAPSTCASRCPSYGCS